MKKIIFMPLSNTLSHITEDLAVADLLKEDHYRVEFVCSKTKKAFIEENGYKVYTVRELWEKSGEQELLRWFDDGNYFRECVEDEIRILDKLAPDLVVASYRYTTKISCRKLNIPRFTIIGPNMTPHFKQLLGIPRDKINERTINGMLYVYKKCLRNVMQSFDEKDLFEGLIEFRDLLEGDITFLHTIPEFEILQDTPKSYKYVGPIYWQGWRKGVIEDPIVKNKHKKLVLVFMGSIVSSKEILYKIMDAIAEKDYQLIVCAASEYDTIKARFGNLRHIIIRKFVYMDDVLPLCDLAVIHGGLGTILNCLRYGVPCLILPYQVEQAQNALRAEEIGFGRNLLGGRLRSNSGRNTNREIIDRVKVFLRFGEEIEHLTKEGIAEEVNSALSDSEYLQKVKSIADNLRGSFKKYRGANLVHEYIADFFSDPV